MAQARRLCSPGAQRIRRPGPGLEVRLGCHGLRGGARANPTVRTRDLKPGVAGGAGPAAPAAARAGRVGGEGLEAA